VTIAAGLEADRELASGSEGAGAGEVEGSGATASADERPGAGVDLPGREGDVPGAGAVDVRVAGIREAGPADVDVVAIDQRGIAVDGEVAGAVVEADDDVALEPAARAGEHAGAGDDGGSDSAVADVDAVGRVVVRVGGDVRPAGEVPAGLDTEGVAGRYADAADVGGVGGHMRRAARRKVEDGPVADAGDHLRWRITGGRPVGGDVPVPVGDVPVDVGGRRDVGQEPEPRERRGC
jgi:hypothetical protein